MSGGAIQPRQLAKKPEVVKALTRHRDKIAALVTLGLRFESCHASDLLDSAIAMQARYGLLTNDSLIVAMALRLHADGLVSADECFATVAEIRVYGPSDLTLLPQS